MTFQYVSLDEAIKRSGVRMVVVGGVPSPWGEAAKGILHIKRIEWVAVRLVCSTAPTAPAPWARMTSGESAASSAACLRISAALDAVQRMSIRTLLPMVQPKRASACMNAPTKA